MQYPDSRFYHDGMKFTARGVDNDNFWGVFNINTNCATDSGRNGGWWFNSCHWVCLTCDGTHFSWWSLPGADPDKEISVGRMMTKAV